MKVLVYGLVTGIFFGFFLQKGRVLRYDKQLGALRLMDMTIVKFMLSTVLIAMVGIYLLKDLGLVKLSVKSTNLGGNIIGGLLFGAGWGFWAIARVPLLALLAKAGGMPSGELLACLSGLRFLPKYIPP
jgi:hypothetical protein